MAFINMAFDELFLWPHVRGITWRTVSAEIVQNVAQYLTNMELPSGLNPFMWYIQFIPAAPKNASFPSSL